MRGGFKVLVSGAALVAMTLAGVSTATAQEPAAAPQEPKKPVFPLPQACQDCEVVLVQMIIKADKAADFEGVLSKVKEALAKSEKPGRKEQAATWVVFKAGVPGPKTKEGTDTVIYFLRMDPVVKGADYDLMTIVYEVFPVEAQEVFAKYKDAFAGRAVIEMKRLMPMQ
jgi:hypothetical protein